MADARFRRLSSALWVHRTHWFPLFTRCHHEESPLQHQAQEISGTFPPRYVFGNLHQSCCRICQPPNSIECWLRRWALGGVVLIDLVVDPADLTGSVDERDRGGSRIVFQDRIRRDLDVAPVDLASGAVVGDAERRSNRAGKRFRYLDWNQPSRGFRSSLH